MACGHRNNTRRQMGVVAYGHRNNTGKWPPALPLRSECDRRWPPALPLKKCLIFPSRTVHPSGPLVDVCVLKHGMPLVFGILLSGELWGSSGEALGNLWGSSGKLWGCFGDNLGNTGDKETKREQPRRDTESILIHQKICPPKLPITRLWRPYW